MRLFSLLMLLMVGVSPGAEKSEAFAPSIYPFENGVRYPTVAEGAAALKQMGYPGVGSVHGEVLEDFLREFDAAGLRVFSIYVGGKVGAESYDCDPIVFRAIRMLKGRDALVELYLLADKDANDVQAVAFVQEVAKVAKQAGLKVVLYPHSGFHIETVEDALRVARASKCDNVGVAFNLCHFLKVQPQSDLRQTLELANPLLWSVSVSGADVGGTDWNALIQPLDAGSYDQLAVLRHLSELGYEGNVGLQCFGLKIPSRQHLPRSIAAWSKNLTALEAR